MDSSKKSKTLPNDIIDTQFKRIFEYIEYNMAANREQSEENNEDRLRDMKRYTKTIHEGNKCDSCGKTFNESGNLKRHIKNIHEGEKNYKCNYCGKSFSESGNLKRHIKTLHEGQKNHKCVSCGKSFIQSVNLKTHIKTIHEGES